MIGREEFRVLQLRFHTLLVDNLLRLRFFLIQVNQAKDS